MEKAIKELRNVEATRRYDVPEDVLGMLGDYKRHNLTTYIKGEWSKYSNEVTVVALKKTPKATKRSNHRTTSLFTHTAKLVRRILRRTTEKKTEDVHEDQFGFRGGKGTRDTTGMLIIISERTLDRVLTSQTGKRRPTVQLTKFPQILIDTNIDRRESRMISKLNIDASVKARLD